ncbi:acyl-CoA dehydrogenase [Mycobacterium sp. DL99]|uniref:acyl-CoA dehydrogenase n=1 Tax=Mycobacterium sp. DL99 TaxID=2528957 RepID=UPI001081AFAF|nr:acyl-CoA dehydrogenase [Mycobacterium sp. DL99]
MTVARTIEQAAAQDAVRAFARSHHVIDAARDEDGLSWRRLWPALGELDLFGVALPEKLGGAGGTLSDLAAMLEQCGAELIPGPVIATVVAALVCGTDSAVPQSICADIVAGNMPVALAVGSSDAEIRRTEDGREVLTGTFPAVDGASVDSLLLVSARQGDRPVWALVEAGNAGTKLNALPGIDFAAPLSRVTFRDVPATAVLTQPHSEIEDLYLIATAAICTGIARRCVQIAADYAKTREQFGQPIGRFQAIKHLCAEMLCRGEQSDALVWDAAAADSTDRPLAAAAAGAICLDAAVTNAKNCIQVLGAIGFTWEHDAHLYLRKALALRHHCGGSTRWRKLTAQRARSDTPRTLRVDLGADEAQRPRVRKDLAEIAALPEDERQRALADSGYLAPHWPNPYGRNASTAQQLLISEEMQMARIERPNLIIGWWAAPTILEAGTPEQLDRYIIPTLRGDLIWCQLFSEPGAGSDLASLSTLATRETGGWRLNGQKVWPTQARDAHWAICLARTDRTAPKHRGITYFLLDMSTPGIDVRPLRAMTGEPMLNEVFLDDVFVPDDCVLGEVNDGWRLARSTLANERVEMNTGTLGGPTLGLLELTKDCNDDGVLDEVGQLVAEATANSLLAHRSILDRMSGVQPGDEASLHKLVGVRQRQRVTELAMTLKGADGICTGPETFEFLLTRSLSIAGGSAQVLLSLVGERMLGLPR